jgi:hypothetical protein
MAFWNCSILRGRIVSVARDLVKIMELYIPWPIVLDIVLLDFLHVMIRLWIVHALGVLPSEIAYQTHGGKSDDRQPESWTGHDDRQGIDVFRADVQLGRDESVYGQEYEPDADATRDCNDGVFGPDVSDQSCLEKHRYETCRVHGSAPYPMASDLSVRKWAVIPINQDGAIVQDHGMVEPIAHPGPEIVPAEEDTLLGELIELWVAV